MKKLYHEKFPGAVCFLQSLLCILFIAVSCASNGHAQGYLHASGIYIVDGTNTKIQLRGMGLGGWLVPEGYMLGTNSPFDSPTGFQNAVLSVMSPANADQFSANYRKYYVQRKDIDSLARWGFNSVRLPMHYNLLSSAPGTYLESGFAIIDSLLAWCEANRLYLILDLHAAPGGQNTGNISDYQGYPSLWEEPSYQRWTAELWKQIATRYATKEWIGGYDLLNEPAFSFSGGNNTPLRTMLMRITDSIRTVDKNHLIFAEGNWYATDFSNLTPAWDTNMAWSFHKYWNVNDMNAFQGYLNLRANTQCPLWLGESGENSNQWFADCIWFSEKFSIGWSWWTLKKIESVACPLSVTRSANYQKVLDYWNGKGSKPTESSAVAALNEQAALLDADKCKFHPDFLDALFRVSTTDVRKPFADNTIPGAIFAVNYDMGKNGLAFFDVDFQNVSGPGGGAYNSGWSYRNDGVDIEKCTDSQGNGYDVGWTNNGEFLGYTVNIRTAGTYSISVRASSGASGGTLNLSLDGTVFTNNVAIPSTGGWQNWQTVSMGNYQLPAGTHDLSLNCVTGGYDLSRLDFALVAAGVHEERQKPLVFALLQNYPNPFNPATTIGYTVGGIGDQGSGIRNVKLVVYNLLGQEVATLVNEKQAPGRYTVRFDAGKLPSGIYLYRLQAGNYVETKRMLLLR